jgi:hypothetical protein
MVPSYSRDVFTALPVNADFPTLGVAEVTVAECAAERATTCHDVEELAAGVQVGNRGAVLAGDAQSGFVGHA